MTSIQKTTAIVVSILALAVAFAAGRHSAPSASLCGGVSTDTKTDTSVKKDVDTHKVTVVEEEPSGAKKTTTTEDTTTKIAKDVKTDTDTKVAAVKLSNVSLLVGYDYRHGTGLSYGASLTHQIKGPVSVGVFGLSNGTIGLSAGLEF